jgi:hypothetical protein
MMRDFGFNFETERLRSEGMHFNCLACYDECSMPQQKNDKE